MRIRAHGLLMCEDVRDDRWMVQSTDMTWGGAEGWGERVWVRELKQV